MRLKPRAWSHAVNPRRLVVVIAVLALGGCAGHGPTGTVHGMITMTGGPRQASPAGAPGTVVASRHGGEVARQKVADGAGSAFVEVGEHRAEEVGQLAGDHRD